MTATLEALGERRGQPTTAVVTSDGAIWSWPELFAYFAPAIHSFARSRGVSSPEDIVQDVFTTAVERFPRFEGDSSGLRSFLFTLAYRRIADEHRTTHRRPEQLVADHAPTPDQSPGIEDSVADIESAREAMEALDILNERERRVIEMRIIDEASPAEVAGVLGLSNGNVRVIQARALMKIRKHLASKSGSMPSIGLVFAFGRGLRSERPLDSTLAAWAEMVQSDSTRDSAKAAAAGGGSAIAAGTASIATVSGTVLKVGLVFALATASTSAVEAGAPDRRAALQVPAVAPSVVNAAEDAAPAGFSVPSAIVDAPTPDLEIAPVAPGRPNLAPPSKAVGVDPATGIDQTPSKVVAERSDEGDGPIVGDVVEPLVDDVTDSVDDVVNGVVDTVDTVVEDVVEPVVATVVKVVDDTTDTVTNVVNDTTDTVTNVVNDTTDTVTNVVNDTTDTVTNVVNDTTDTVTNVVGGLFGG